MASILDHVSLNVSDMAKSKAFYTQALAPLGITMLMDFGRACGFGKGQKPELWLGAGPASFQKAEDLGRITPVHLCLVAKNRAEVDAFHAAATAAGGRDFGKPGIREVYHPNYYGAFVLDPDGHNIEACIHHPE